MKLQSLEELNGKTKGEIFKGYPITFDYALPQDWLDRFSKWCNQNEAWTISYNLILATTVWVYPEGNYFGQPKTACLDVYAAMQEFMGNDWNNFPEEDVERRLQLEEDAKLDEAWERHQQEDDFDSHDDPRYN